MRVPQPLHWYIGDETSLIPYESGQLDQSKALYSGIPSKDPKIAPPVQEAQIGAKSKGVICNLEAKAAKACSKALGKKRTKLEGFEDEFPIKNGDIPLVQIVLSWFLLGVLSFS